VEDQKGDTFVIPISKMVNHKIVPSQFEVCVVGSVWRRFETPEGKKVELRESTRKSIIKAD
jgi:hypothetical protein